MMGLRRYTKDKEELITEIKEYYEKYGKYPSAVSFQNDKNYTNPNKFIKEFGSWSKAVEIAKSNKV